MAKKEKASSKDIVPVATAIPTVAPSTGALAAIPTDLAAWGMEQQLTAKDIVIPRILSMQAMSNLVTSGEAKFGEFRNSMTKAVMGDISHPIDIIPFFMRKVFVVMREKEGKFVFNREELITPQLEDHAFEHVTNDGKKEKWYRTYNFFVLLPHEVADGRALPYQLSLRSSSARAGQNLATQMYTINFKAKKFPPSVVMRVSGKKTSNDKGTFVVMEVTPEREATEAEVKEAFEWASLVAKGSVKVDTSDLEAEVMGETAAPAPESNDY